MSKNKFFKKLLIAGLCVVSATAVIGGVAACKKNDDEDKKQEQTLEYTVSYDLDGGEWGTATHTDKVAAGGKLTKPGNPTKTGKVFDKWVLVATGADYDFESAVNANLALKAVWKDPVATYTVTLDLDGGTWTGAQATYTATAGQKLSDVLGTLLDSDPTKTGYEFLGLLIGTEDADSDTVISANVTVKVNWKLLHQHTWAQTVTSLGKNSHGIKATCNEPGEHCDTAIKPGSEVPHVDANHDGKCDTCEYDDSASLTAKFKELVADEGRILADTFTQSVAKLANKNDDWATAGIYYNYGTDGSLDTHYVKVENGKAVLVTPNAKPSTNLNVVFGSGATGVVKGYFEVSDFTSGITGYTPIQFVGATGNEIFGLRADTSWKYRLNGGSAVTPAQTIAINANKIYFEYDNASNSITVKIDDTVLVEDLALTGDNLKGIKFATGDGNSKSFSVDNMVVVNTPYDVASLKAIKDAQVTAIMNSKYVLTMQDVTDQGLTGEADIVTYATAVDDAKSAYDTAVGADGLTVEQLNTAYDTFDNAIKLAIATFGDTYFEADARYGATKYTTGTDDATKTAYEALVARKEAAKTDAEVTAQDAIDLFEEIMLTLDGDPEKGIEPEIKNADWFAAPAVTTIKVSDGTNEYNIPTSIVKKAGDFLHISDINAIVAATASDKTVTKYYEDSSKTQEATFWKVEENLIVYVDVASASSDKGVYTYTATGSTLNKVASEGSLGDAETIFTLDKATVDKGIVKFGGSDQKVILTLKVQAGQTVTLDLDLKSGSTVKVDNTTVGYKKVDLKATPSSGLSLTSASDTVTVDAVGKTGADDTTHEAVTTAPTNSGTIVFTATTTGTVTIELARVAGATTQMSQLVITVADPA